MEAFARPYGPANVRPRSGSDRFASRRIDALTDALDSRRSSAGARHQSSLRTPIAWARRSYGIALKLRRGTRSGVVSTQTAAAQDAPAAGSRCTRARALGIFTRSTRESSDGAQLDHRHCRSRGGRELDAEDEAAANSCSPCAIALSRTPAVRTAARRGPAGALRRGTPGASERTATLIARCRASSLASADSAPG